MRSVWIRSITVGNGFANPHAFTKPFKQVTNGTKQFSKVLNRRQRPDHSVTTLHAVIDANRFVHRIDHFAAEVINVFHYTRSVTTLHAVDDANRFIHGTDHFAAEVVDAFLFVTHRIADHYMVNAKRLLITVA